jgi:hypothetical protein
MPEANLRGVSCVGCAVRTNGRHFGTHSLGGLTPPDKGHPCQTLRLI